MITVLKFGGASIQDAERIRNVRGIVQSYQEKAPILVVSALGKTTNALEEILKQWYQQDPIWQASLNQLLAIHLQIATALSSNASHALQALFGELESFLSNADRSKTFDQYYDHIIAYGELASTTLLAIYFQESGLACEWVDARKIIRTDNHFRDVNIDWKETELLAKERFHTNTLYLTQGFIGATADGETTTLGREGSDYTASILSYCLDAKEMIIWKDVAGVMNADPKLVPDASVINKISYREAVEMTYFGAKVIHPKTIKPLQNKHIPLLVKCFIDPSLEGTIISEATPQTPYPPIIVWKDQQVLLSIQDKDFSFIAEKHLTSIFNLFNQHRVHIHLMQNSAISFSVCVDANPRVSDLIKDLSHQFDVVRNEGMRLLTIRHYDESTIAKHLAGNEILVEQRSRSTIQLVTRKK